MCAVLRLCCSREWGVTYAKKPPRCSLVQMVLAVGRLERLKLFTPAAAQCAGRSMWQCVAAEFWIQMEAVGGNNQIHYRI
jgi:hypothetical protein